MEIGNPKPEGRMKPESRGARADGPVFQGSGFRLSVFGVRCWVLLWLELAVFGWNAAAASLAAAADDEKIPPLRPPHGLIPPDLWEQYAVWMVVGGLFCLLLVAAAIWFILRPKPAVVIPAETQARRALEALRQGPETGAVLSRVSQILRSYFSTAFGLRPGELTTAEFCRVLTDAPEPGAELSRQVAIFLRECDVRKFGPAAPVSPMGAVAQALQLVADAESRRAQARAAANASPGLRLPESPPIIPPAAGAGTP